MALAQQVRATPLPPVLPTYRRSEVRLIDLSAVQQETGDYRAVAASARQALQLSIDLGDRYGQAGVNMGGFSANRDTIRREPSLPAWQDAGG
jgi:hypothetical protein